jgi:diacylglycerol kinase family enzyme
VLIANPNATTTDSRTRDVLTAALSSVVDLHALTTTHRGHAGELAVQAVRDKLDLVVTLGGDGTVHEVVNGMLETGETDLPAVAPIPGGSANVFARALGLPNDPVGATGAILASLRQERFRRIGLGKANGRWFIINAGMGLDAEVVAAMERHRDKGRKATPTRYVSTAVREFFVHTDRKHPALTVLREDGPPVDHVYLAIVQNCSPWTYLGGMPANACPEASFETGLDVMAVRSMGVVQGLRVTGRLLRGGSAEVDTDSLFIGHDLDRFVLSSTREIELQVDGEAVGPTRHVTLESVPDALRVIDVR